MYCTVPGTGVQVLSLQYRYSTVLYLFPALAKRSRAEANNKTHRGIQNASFGKRKTSHRNPFLLLMVERLREGCQWVGFCAQTLRVRDQDIRASGDRGLPLSGRAAPQEGHSENVP